MIRVVKVGGSLLDWPLLAHALQQWLWKQPPAFNVLVAGGGKLADLIRQADRNFEIGDERSHWLCIDAMSISAQILAAAMPSYGIVSELAALNDLSTTAHHVGVVFDPRDFLRHQEARLPGQRLPRDWSATSDSIAARLAQALTANDLVLLKSADPPAGSLDSRAASGYVDRYFPIAAAGLAPRFVNLRATTL